MELIKNLVATATQFLPVLGAVIAVVAVLFFVDRILKRRWKDNPDVQFRFQLIMLALTFAGLLSIILALPVSVETRGQLLSLIGILLSAAIALSSTTFIGNMMAGIMLRAVKSARPGDFVTVAELTGRITEMGLLHTEVQTEFRDLVTVPNLYMVTQPMRVVRSSGTIITAEEIRKSIELLDAEIAALKDQEADAAVATVEKLTARKSGLVQQLKHAEEQLKD